MGLALKLGIYNCWFVTQNFFKYDYHRCWEILSNTALLEFRLKIWFTIVVLTEQKFKQDFQNICYFTLPSFQVFFQKVE